MMGTLDKSAYLAFLQSKFRFGSESGHVIDLAAINPMCKPHQRDLIAWGVRKGRAAYFAAFGLGKSFIQLETVRLVLEHTGGCGLIVLPLGVRLEFRKDAEKLGITVTFIKRSDEIAGPGIYLTNYESVRDGKVDVALFTVASLDEASVLRSYGSLTFQTFLKLFEAVPYRYVATATPSPNSYKELIHYAGFLGVMDTGQALTRFFQRDSEKANNLTIYKHMEREFHLWLHSWAAFVQKPSDLGYSDDGYDMPELIVRTHEVQALDLSGGADRDGQALMFKDAALGLKEASTEKRESIAARVAKMMEIIAASPDDHFIIWHDLESERHAIKAALPEASEVFGSLDLDERETRTWDFAEGRTRYLATKPVVSGSGANLQRHCHRAIFLGIGYKFNDFMQAIHRIKRFQQPCQCEVDIIYCETEREVWRTLKRKWQEHETLTERMSGMIAEHGLSTLGLEQELSRTIGVERIEERTPLYHVVNNDTVLECDSMPTDSMDMIATSIPFGNHYEYSASYEDFGHNDNNNRFFDQMDHLTPNLLRMLRPGRVACIHVKDRINFGNVTGYGMPSVEPFHADCIAHYRRHGFVYFGMITIITDVVRENNQTYRLGWSENAKDGTKMGVGSPEYVLLFRKLPTDTSRGYADVPVPKSKGTYTRGRWQVDAHAFWRSSGNRFLTAAELEGYGPDALGRIFPKLTAEAIYNYQAHVEIGDALDAKNMLPATFMAIAPGSHHPDVWHDVNRMRTLNGNQSNRNLVQHVCLARGSFVLTKRGQIAIQDVLPGDLVLTHKGRWRPVQVVRNTGVRPVVKLHAHGVAHLVLTPDHQVWTRRVGSYARQRDAAVNAEPSWLEAESTKGSYVNLKLPEIAPELIQDDAFWWVVGRWLADGHIDKRNVAHISVGPKKLDEFMVRAGRFVVGSNIRNPGTCYQVNLKDPGSILRKVLRTCGRGAENKELPPIAYGLDAASAKSLVDGYLSGDGYYLPARNRWMAASASRKLLLGMAMLVQRVYGSIASVFAGRSERECVIEGRKVTALQEWNMSFDAPPHDRRQKPFILDDGAWRKVREIEPMGEMETWCLRVEEDESFTAEGCVVKNCPLQFDIVDRLIERYSSRGDVVFDPFGGLFTVPYCAIKLGRRGAAVELNADYYRDGVRYLREAEREASMPTLFAAEGFDAA